MDNNGNIFKKQQEEQQDPYIETHGDKNSRKEFSRETIPGRLIVRQSKAGRPESS